MFYNILTFILLIQNVFSSQWEPPAKLDKELCDFGDIVENPCKKCVCTTDGLYNCTSTKTDCRAVKEIYPKNTKPEACDPNKIYVHGYTKCLCTAERQWPHKICYDVFHYLPIYSLTKLVCVPQEYVKVDCNICRCNNEGRLDAARCTVNECHEEKHTFRKNNDEKPSLFGQCVIKNWYSLAPCQFCYCVDTNKLMCSTSILPASRVGAMTLGQSTLTLCGPGLLKEIAALVPNKLLRLRSVISSNEDVNLVNEQDAKHNENVEETNEPIIEKKSVSVNAQPEVAQDTDYDDEKDQAVVNENKDNPQELSLDIAASINANIKRRQNVDSIPISIRNNRILGEASDYFNVRRLLTLDGGTKCKPGTAVNDKCNSCHCLNNGKLICTDNKCN